MYCKVCGNPLKEDDAICTVCGAELDKEFDPFAADAEEQENAPESVDLDGDVEDESSDYDTSDIFSNSKEENRQPFSESNSDKGEFSWNIYDFPKPRKTEDIRFDWGDGVFPDKLEAGQGAEEEKEKELFPGPSVSGVEWEEAVADAGEQFSFDEKNEEFQKLLDREYERLQGMERPLSENRPTFPDLGVWKAEQEIPKLDAENVEQIVSELESAGDKPEKTPIPVYIAGIGAETMASLRELNEGKEKEDDNQKENKTEGENPEVTSDTIEIPKVREETSSITSDEIREMIQRELERKAVPVPAPIYQPVSQTPIPEPVPAPVYQPAPQAPAYQPAPQAPVPTPPPAPVYAAPSDYSPVEEVREIVREEEKDREPLWFEEEEQYEEGEEEEGRRFSVLRLLLLIILILLAAEIVTLGIKFFAPESRAAEFVTKGQMAIVNTLSEGKDRIVGLFAGDDKKSEEQDPAEKQDGEAAKGEKETPVDETGTKEEGTTEEEKPVDTTPATDKTVLIEAVEDSNKNIATVRANEALAYVKGRDYGNTDINTSQPLTENVWSGENTKNPVLYDREIVRTLIAFDSGWIEYVNGGSDDVISLTKVGSRAYRSASSFSKVGKVKETFDLLEIGEIRKGGKGYYVWTYEEITKTEAGKTTTSKYHWIYYLEPVEGEIKIVDYIKY